MSEIETPPIVTEDKNGDKFYTFSTEHSFGDVARWIVSQGGRDDMLHILTYEETAGSGVDDDLDMRDATPMEETLISNIVSQRDYIEVLEAQLKMALDSKDASLALCYAEIDAVEDKLERISDAWSDALYSDLENGVSSINDRVALEFSRRYPAISNFGNILLNIMLEENA